MGTKLGKGRKNRTTGKAMAKRPAGAILSMLAPARRSGLSLQKQLYDAVRKAILQGGLPPGSRLPSTRSLASEWNLGRNTVVNAFEQLVAEGYLESRTGSGTYVSHHLPEGFLTVTQQNPANEASFGQGQPTSPPSRRGQRIASAGLGTEAGRPIPFAPGIPALDAFPTDLWRRLTARRTRLISREMLCYGDPRGYRPLRQALAAYLNTARGVRCDWQQILVLSGSQQALDLSARLLLDPGDQVWMEDPGYPGARGALAAADASLVPVPVDGEGLDVEEGMRRAPGARVAYVTPSHQYPLGVTLSLRRRLALLRWAGQKGAWILEDDYNSEYRYAGNPLHSLQGLDGAGRVVYIGTFSKVLFPSLRLGYLVAPPSLADAFFAARTLVDGHSPTLPQAILTEFIEEGHFAAHIRRMRSLYQKRQQLLLHEASRRLSDWLQLEPADSGMHLVGSLPSGSDDDRISRQAAQRGIEAPSLSHYFLGPATRKGLVLGYCGVPSHEIRRGVQVLEEVLRQF
ncbi:MAG: PLP-dependent aminotransferase family protein [Acidobacteriota bacterium]